MFKISFATNLALHAMGTLAAVATDKPLSVGQLAGHIGASENHLAKVMQRLCKMGLVISKRGPRGGFGLSRDPRSIRLLDVYEAMEGPWEERLCMMDRPMCRGNECLMGDLLGSIQQQVRNHLTNTTLASLDWAHLDLVSDSRDGDDD